MFSRLFIILIVQLIRTSPVQPSTALQPNNCYREQTLSLVLDQESKPGVSNLQIIDLLKTLYSLYKEVKILPYIENGQLYTDPYTCLIYGQLYKLTEENENFKDASTFQFRNAFLIKDNHGEHCILDGIYANKNNCKMAMTKALNQYGVQLELEDPIINSTLNIFQIENAQTYILGLKRNKAKWISTQNGFCKDIYVSDLLKVQTNIRNVLISQMKLIFQILKPFVSEHDDQSKIIKITNNQQFVSNWKTLSHHHQLYKAITNSSVFPDYIFDKNSLSQVESQDISYLQFIKLVDPVIHKRSILSYIFNGDEIDSLKRNNNQIRNNFIKTSHNFRKINADYNKIITSNNALNTKQSNQDQRIANNRFYLSQVISDLKKIKLITSKHFTILNAKLFLTNVESQVLSLQNTLPQTLARLFTAHNECYFSDNTFICNKENIHYSFGNDIFEIFTYKEKTFRTVFYFTCLPIYKNNQSLIFQGDQQLFLKSGNNYKQINNNFTFNEDCLKSSQFCQSLYKNKNATVFDQCYTAVNSYVIYLSCKNKLKIYFSSGVFKMIGKEPQLIQYTDFPLRFENKDLTLEHILNKFQESSFHTEHFLTFEESDQSPSLTLNEINAGKIPLLNKDYFESIVNTEEFSIGHAFLTTTAVLTVILLIILHFCCLQKCICYSKAWRRLTKCKCCKSSDQSQSQQDAEAHPLQPQQQLQLQDQQQQQDTQPAPSAPQVPRTFAQAKPKLHKLVNNSLNENFQTQYSIST